MSLLSAEFVKVERIFVSFCFTSFQVLTECLF